MAEQPPPLHEQHEDIVEAAKMHATYYRQLVWEHNVHPDNATQLTQTFMELAFQKDDE